MRSPNRLALHVLEQMVWRFSSLKMFRLQCGFKMFLACNFGEGTFFSLRFWDGGFLFAIRTLQYQFQLSFQCCILVRNTLAWGASTVHFDEKMGFKFWGPGSTVFYHQIEGPTLQTRRSIARSGLQRLWLEQKKSAGATEILLGSNSNSGSEINFLHEHHYKICEHC